MKAWQVTKPKTMSVIDSHEEIKEGYVKVKVTMASLSLSDAKIYKGEVTDKNIYPAIIGRHGAGIISEVNPDNPHGFERGQRVVIDPNLPCNNCFACKNNKKWNCSNLKVMGVTEKGMLREFILVPYSNVYQLPAQVDDKQAQFVEHTATAIRTFNELRFNEGEHVVIIGASILGIIAAQLAMYYQLVPIILDAHQDKLDIAQNYGFYYTVNTSTENPFEKIKKITGGRYCENVIYLANSNDQIQKAFEFSAIGGKVAIVGWENIAEVMSGDISSVLLKQLEVFGITNGNKQVPAAINLLAKKTVDISGLIYKEISFDETETALSLFSENPLLYHKILVKI